MMLGALTVLALAGSLQAQVPGAEQFRRRVLDGDSLTLFADVRERPDDARELIRLLLIDAGTRRGAQADSALALARRIGEAYAATWEDDFPLLQAERFAAESPAWRRGKLAADSVRRAGNTAHRRSNDRVAITLWREAVRRSAAIDDSAGVAAALGNIGTAFHGLGELDSAETHLVRARTLAERVGDRRTAANAVGLSGAIALERGDLAGAQQLHSAALELRSRIGDVRGAAADHNNLGLISAELGQRDEARAHHEHALTLAREHALDEPAAAALLNLGNAASLEAEYAQAERLYRESMALYRALESEADVSLVLHNLGVLAMRRGDYRSAGARLSEARAILVRLADTAGMLVVDRDLASVAMAAGELREAMVLLRRAEQLLGPARDDPEPAARLALARADLAVYLNAFTEAEQHYGRAEALFRRARSTAGQAEAQEGRALLLAERRQYDRALELLRAAARLQAASGDRRPAALTQLAIGHVQHRQSDLPAARRTLERTVDSLRVLGDVVAEAAALGALADVELDAGAALAAEALLRRGLARLRQRPAPDVAWQLHAGLGRALASRGALAEAASELRAAVDDIERMATTLPGEDRRSSFLTDKWDVYSQLAMVQRSGGNAAGAFATSERLRARQMLEALTRGRVATASSADSALTGEEQDLRRRIAELTRRLETDARSAETRRGPSLRGEAGAMAVTREALAAAQERYARLLLDLRESAAPHAVLARLEAPTWAEITSRLTSGEVLIEYLVADSTTIAFVLTRDSLRAVDLNVDRRTLASLVDFTRGTLGRPEPRATAAATTPAWRAPLRRLHQLLVAPIEETGALAGAHRLIIVPHAELHYLPFAALVGPAPGGLSRDEFLIERYELSYSPSAAVWVRLGERARARQVPPRGRGSVLALAPRTGALPGSRAEVEAIGAIYGTAATILLDGNATEQAFRLAASRYDIVHLATYGVLNKHNPLFSHVSLTARGDDDGRIEVHEVFGLSLDARLLVLSACQTGLGSGAISDVPAGDDWVGLVRAFLGVGVQNVIATLWPVEDRSTARFMERLHRELRSGASEAAALAVAQRAALHERSTADPFYWAGFVLVGGR